MSLIGINDLAEVKFGSNIINTRIVTMDLPNNIINLLHKKTNSIIILKWQNNKWRFEDDDTEIEYVKFMKSAISDSDQYRTSNIIELTNFEKMNILLNTDPNEFIRLSKMDDFDIFYNGIYRNRLYKEKLERDIKPAILTLAYEFKPANMAIDEFYRRLIDLQKYTFPNKFGYTYDIFGKKEPNPFPDPPYFIIEQLLDNNLYMEAKILMKYDSKYRPTYKALDNLALKHRTRMLDYLVENGYLDGMDLSVNISQEYPYLYRWAIART